MDTMQAVDTTGYKRKALLITGLGTFLGTLDSSIVNVSLPSITRDLNTTVNMVGWVIMSYAIIIISLLLVFGSISARKGFHYTYTYGFAIFMVGSFMCGLSINIYMLILCRVLQGVGAAMLMAVGPAMVTRSFPEKERGRGLSVIAMVVSVGLLLGPPLGGFIIGLAGWRWIFYVNIPVCIAGIYFTNRFIRDFPIEDPHKRIHVPGAIALAAGLMTMMMSLMLFSEEAISKGGLIGILAFSVLMFLLFFYFESKPDTKLIGLDIFKIRVFAFSGAAMLLVFISLASVTVLMPFYLERIKLLDPQHVGLYLSIVPICTLIMAPLAGYLSDKIQARFIATLGVLIMGTGLFLTGRLNGDSGFFEIARVLVLLGLGMGLFSTPNTSTMMGSVQRSQLGSASGLNATIRTLGITFGVGLAISIFGYFRSAGVESGLGETEAFLSGFNSVYNYIIYVIIAAMVFSWIRGNDKSKGGRGPGFSS